MWYRTLPHATKVFVCGNHDFSACTAGGFYETRGRELNAKYSVKDAPDDVERAREVLSERSLREGGLKYLDNEAWEFTVDREETRHHTWKVWGSPVSTASQSELCERCMADTEGSLWTVVARVRRLGVELQARRRGSRCVPSLPYHYTIAQTDPFALQTEIHAGIPADIDLLITHTPPQTLGRLDAIHDGTPVGCEELTRRLTAPRAEPHALRPLLHVFGHIHEARGVHLLQQEEDETVLVNAALVEYDQDMWNLKRVCKYETGGMGSYRGGGVRENELTDDCLLVDLVGRQSRIPLCASK